MMQKSKTTVQQHTEATYYHTDACAYTLKAHSVLGMEVEQKGSRVLQAGEERQTRSTHTVYFHLALGKLSQAQQASGSNFFGSCAFKKGKNDWFKKDFMLISLSHFIAQDGQKKKANKYLLAGMDK